MLQAVFRFSPDLQRQVLIVASDIPPDSESPLPEDTPVSSQESEGVEEMPEFEELTPELMEDECLRGDIMLRSALILLALLLGWTLITESSLLVSIRTGEYLLQHGILPPAGDVFSASALGRPWINQAWLSDLLLAAVHAVTGMSGLTVLCALTVAASFVFLSKITVPRVSTWWGSFCGLLALIALFPEFQPGTSSLTILAFSILLWCLSCETFLPADAEDLKPLHRFSWNFPYLPVLFLLWVNFDPRAWAGLFILLLFMAGDSLSRKLRKQHQSHRDWGIVLAACLVGMLLTPWPFQQIANVGHWFQERRALRLYSGASEFFSRLIFGLKDPGFWNLLDLYAVMSLALLVISLITMLLNWKKLNLGWLAVWLGMNALSIVDGNAVCYAALVNAVIATLNGQSWYKDHYSMAYSIDTMSIFWGRGGRAVMVLTYFVLAYLALNGAFMGPQSRRLGLGLDPRWSARINSMQNRVVAHAYTDKFFPTIASQGDVLIWLGKKPFIDSRFSLYLNGPQNLLQVHQETRTALFSPGTKEKPTDPNIWKKTLHDAGIYDVVVRLWGPAPPYEPLLRLLSSPSWVMTGLGGAGANFTRIDQPSEPLLKHVESYSATQFARLAFRPEAKPIIPELQAVWPAPVSRYDRWLIQKLQITPEPAALAAHYEQLLNVLDQGTPAEEVCGLACLAIRHTREALAVDPNSAVAYRVQAQAYRVLQQVESQVQRVSGVDPAGAGNYSDQILAASNAAVIAGGANPIDLQRLLDVTLAQQQIDIALTTLVRFRKALENFPGQLISKDRMSEFDELESQLQAGVDEVKKKIDDARTSGAVRAQLVGMALQGRCPALALSILEEDLTELERSPEMKLLYGSLQIQTGSFDLALQTLEQMEPIIKAPSPPPQMQGIISNWQNQTALANLGTQDYKRALELWDQEDQSFIRTAVRSLLQLPFAATSLPVQYEIWPAYYARMAAGAAIEVPERIGQLQLRSARIELAAGQLEAATARLQSLLKSYPQSSHRFLAAFYLSMLTGKKVEVAPNPQTKPQPPATEPSTNQPSTPQ